MPASAFHKNYKFFIYYPTRNLCADQYVIMHQQSKLHAKDLSQNMHKMHPGIKLYTHQGNFNLKSVAIIWYKTIMTGISKSPYMHGQMYVIKPD